MSRVKYILHSTFFILYSSFYFFPRISLRINKTAGHKTTARDHVHPTFKPDGTEIEIQSAMLSDDGRSMNICIVRLPQHLIDKYKREK